MSNHYRTLGVDPQADPVVIRGAYLALIRRYHPDKGGEEADAARAQAVTAAWDVLRDPARRAAYDENRTARFQPGGGAGGVGVGARARGGSAGRNLFLLLAAGTAVLGWWALQQPLPGSGTTVAAVESGAIRSDPVTLSEPTIRPVEDESAGRQRIEEQAEVPLPDVPREPETAAQVEVPSLPEAPAVRLPLRTAEAKSDRAVVSNARPQPVVAAKVAQPDRSAPTASASPIDLVPLQRHLKLLTEQSMRFGTEAKRNRLFATSEGFAQRLRECDSDACKRDTYLRRNAEVAEIMRGGG